MHGYRAFRVALVGALLLCGRGSAGDLSETDRLRFADGLYARGMHALAVKEYTGFLDAYPESKSADVAYFRVGECYRELKNLPEAEKAYRTVFNDYPESPYRLKAGCKRADLFIENGQYDAALDLFDLVLAQGPDPEIAAACHFFKGEALRKSGRRDSAIPEFEKVVGAEARSRYYSYALLELGSIWVRDKGDPVKGLAFFAQAAESADSDRVRAEAWFQMADLHYRQDAFEKSAEYYRKLLTEYPTDDRALEAVIQSGWAAYRAGFYAEALERASRAVAGFADDAADRPPTNAARAEWLYLKANSERQLMKNKEATATYAALIETYPDSPFAGAARYEKAVAFYKMGMYEQAIAEVSALKTEGTLSRDVYWLLAESYAALKKDEEATQFYRLLTRHFPESDLARDAGYRLAHHLQSAGNNREAVRQYQLVAEKFPDSELAPKALFASALCLLRDGAHAEAARDLDTLIKRYPASDLVEKSLYQRAMCEIHLGRSDDAQASLRDLPARFPKTEFKADVHHWIGMLLLQSEKLEDAQTAFAAALTSSPREELRRNTEFYLGLALYRQGKKEEALKRFTVLLSSPVRERFSPELLTWISESLFAEKQYVEAGRAARVLADLRDDERWRQVGWGLLGRSEAAAGNAALARDAFGKALECDAQTRFAGEAALRLGEMLFADGDIENAETYFARAAAMAGDDAMSGLRAAAYAGLGRAAKHRGDLENAARYFMSVAVLYDDPGLVPACLREAADAFKSLGQEEAAERAMSELTTRYPDSPEARPAAKGSE